MANYGKSPRTSALLWATPVALAAFLAVLLNGQSKTKVPEADLQGVWGLRNPNASRTTVSLGNKEFYTKEEAAAYEKRVMYDNNKDLGATVRPKTTYPGLTTKNGGSAAFT